MRGRLAAFNKQDRDFSGLYDEKVVYKQITKFTQYFIFSNRYKDLVSFLSELSYYFVKLGKLLRD